MENARTNFIIGLLNIIVIALGCSEQSTIIILAGALLCLLFFGRALYLHLLDTKKGLAFLKKIPLKPLQTRIARYETGDRYRAPSKYAISLLPPVYMVIIFTALGIYNWNDPLRISNALSYYEFAVAGFYALYTIYLSLYFFEKVRVFLGKLPFKFIKQRLEQFK